MLGTGFRHSKGLPQLQLHFANDIPGKDVRFQFSLRADVDNTAARRIPD
jgi:hypothetical protein